jgi:hypothetical protein
MRSSVHSRPRRVGSVHGYPKAALGALNAAKVNHQLFTYL